MLPFLTHMRSYLRFIMTNYDHITPQYLHTHYVELKKSWRTIARELGVSDVLLCKLGKRFGIESRSTSEAGLGRTIDRQEATLLYHSGTSISVLAKKYDVSYSVMRYRLLSYGVVLRKPSLARSLKTNRQVPYWAWAQRDWLEKAYAVASVGQIANHVKASRTLVNKFLTRFGIVRRKNLGPKTGHDSNPHFPAFLEADALKSATAKELEIETGLTSEAVAALCAHRREGEMTVPVYRTGPERSSLSVASKRKWDDDSFRQRVVTGNRRKYENEDYRQHMARRRAEHPTISSIQLKLYELLERLGVEHVREGQQTMFGHFSFDCLIPKYCKDKHLLVEVQGDYWHNLDRVVKNDRRKFSFINSYFPDHHLMYVWEHEFEDEEKLSNRLKSKLRLLPDRNYSFDDLRIIDAPAAEAKRFLDAYHYIGGNRNGRAVAALLGDDVVAMALVTSPTRQNMKSRYKTDSLLELSRFCIAPEFHKYNLASWFLSRLVKLIDCQKLLAFADKTMGHLGTIYKAANFDLDHIVAPDYWYASGTAIIHKKTVYNRAKSAGMTETEYAAQTGLIKVYGGEKLAYVYERRTQPS